MRFEKETKIAAPPEAVYAFHEQPDALLAITPPWERVTVDGAVPPIAVGNRIVLKTKIGPFPATWVAEYVEVEPGRLFADRQVSGPFAAWLHRHIFLPDGAGGTVLRDSVEYEPPFGVLGRVFGGWFIKKKLKDMFEFRHQATKRMIEEARG